MASSVTASLLPRQTQRVLTLHVPLADSGCQTSRACGEVFVSSERWQQAARDDLPEAKMALRGRTPSSAARCVCLAACSRPRQDI